MKPITFNKNKPPSRPDIIKVGGKTYCRTCRMNLTKGMAMFRFLVGYDAELKICPFCIIEEAETAKKILEEMDEEDVKEIEAARFTHRL
jgi:hypothetical protein